MASGPISSWQIDRETVTDFIFLGSKITVDGNCRHEIKRCLLLGGKTMTNLYSILKKQRHYFAGKGLSSQSYGFLQVIMNVRVGPCRRLSTKELMLLNCAVGEDS